MKKMLIASVAALVLATPALAQEAPTFTGARIGGNIGFADDDVFGDEAFTYGVEAGYDFDLGSAVVGIGAELQDSSDSGRDISVVARAGAKAADNVLIYALGGYSNLKVLGVKLDGFRIGGGVEVAVGPNAFVKFEHRYTNYDAGGNDDVHQNLIGAGFRF